MAWSARLVLTGAAPRDIEAQLVSALGALGCHATPDPAPAGASDGPCVAWKELRFFGEALEATTLVAVTVRPGKMRPLRAPRWHLSLARALSASAGGFALTYTNDRLQTMYGHGVFFAGRTVEARSREYGVPPVSLGVGALSWPCDEDENRRGFDRYLQALTGVDWFRLHLDQPPLQEGALRLSAAPGARRRPAGEFTAVGERSACCAAFAAPGDELAAALSNAPIPGAKIRPGRTAERYGPPDWEPRSRAFAALEWDGGLEAAWPLARALGCPAAAAAVPGAGRSFRWWSTAGDGRRRMGTAEGAEAFIQLWGPVHEALGVRAGALWSPARRSTRPVDA